MNNRIMKKACLCAIVTAGALVLSSCGARTNGDGGDSQPIYNANGELISGGDGSTPTLGAANPLDALKLRVVSDVNSVTTGGTDVASITVLATDVNNNAVADASILFSSSSGVLQDIEPLTDANGEASATLKLPQDFQNQDIIVTASASNGDYVSAIKVTASGSVLDVSGPENLVSGDSAEIVLRLTAGNGAPIANQPVTVVSAAGNLITPTEIFTDADGSVTVMVGSENSSDTLRISALNGSVSATHDFDVVEDLLSFVDLDDGVELVVGAENVLGVNWTSQRQAQANQALSFSITAGSIVPPSTVITDAAGNASVRVFSNSAGPAKLTVESAQGGAPNTNINVEFVATVPDSISAGSTNSLVSVGETSTVTALVRDRLGNPVKNSEVVFSGVDLKGGQLNPASASTNSAGIANVTFTAGANATSEDEILVQTTVKGTQITDAIRLSVFKRALNVTLGSGNLVDIKPLGTQYGMPLLVQVADGSGTPLPDAIVKVSVRPLAYGKGEMVLVDTKGRTISEAVLSPDEDFAPSRWVVSSSAIGCPAEDLDGDRYLDTLGPLSEDFNNNGSLDPQDPASLTAAPGDYATLSGGSLITDANGSGYFELIYPASNAPWSEVEITARAEALGAEATDTYNVTLSNPASIINTVDSSPAGVYSPYGIDVRSDQVNMGQYEGQDINVSRGCTTTF